MRTLFDIPVQMREVADRSVNEAKKAVEQFLDATQKAVAAESSAGSVPKGVADATRQAMTRRGECLCLIRVRPAPHPGPHGRGDGGAPAGISQASDGRFRRAGQSPR